MISCEFNDHTESFCQITPLPRNSGVILRILVNFDLVNLDFVLIS